MRNRKFLFRSTDLSRWEDIGEVLRVPGMHLSYPNVFELDGQIWMIPETHENKSVSLYHCTDFPFEWEKVTDLLVGDNYVDSCIHFRGGKYYLFTTTWRTDSAGLRVSDSYSNMRCGGCLFEANNTLYRPAQYDENYYGENVMLFKVDSLSTVSYSESFVSSMLDHV